MPPLGTKAGHVATMSEKMNTHGILLVKYGGDGKSYGDMLVRDVLERTGSGLYTEVGSNTSGVELFRVLTLY